VEERGDLFGNMGVFWWFANLLIYLGLDEFNQ